MTTRRAKSAHIFVTESPGVLPEVAYPGDITVDPSAAEGTRIYVCNTVGVWTPTLSFTPENPTNKGVAGGYAGLDNGGLVPASNVKVIFCRKT